MTDAEIQAEAEQCYGQFISSKPHKNSYVGGFIVGATWARAEFEAELAALRERTETLQESNESLAGIAAASIVAQSKLTDELARVREEQDRLGAGLRRSADRFREFAAHCRKSAWPNLGDEFDGFARDCEVALAAGEKEAQRGD